MGTSTNHDGGPAYPVPGMYMSEEFNGMSLRDHFAGLAMHAWASNEAEVNSWFADCGAEKALKFIAERAYGLADAMIKERDK